MSYALPDTSSLETLLDYGASTSAGLSAMKETEPLGKPWDALRAKIRAARDARDDDRWKRLAASALVAVRDAAWDAAVLDLSGRSFLAAGKRHDAPPYSTLFGAIPARAATQLGPHKATVHGDLLLAKAKELAHSDLAASATALGKANHDLAGAAEKRDQAVQAERLHDIERGKLLVEVEKLIARTEVGILTALPGRSDLVRAILSPAHPVRAHKVDDESPAPEQQPA